MSNGKRLQNQYRMLMICMINLGQEKKCLGSGHRAGRF